MAQCRYCFRERRKRESDLHRGYPHWVARHEEIARAISEDISKLPKWAQIVACASVWVLFFPWPLIGDLIEALAKRRDVPPPPNLRLEVVGEARPTSRFSLALAAGLELRTAREVAEQRTGGAVPKRAAAAPTPAAVGPVMVLGPTGRPLNAASPGVAPARRCWAP